MKNAAEQYLGHAVKGGIQQHSLGEDFPWTVIAYGTLDPIEWRAFNCTTNQYGPVRSVNAQAHADIAEYRERAKIVAAIQKRGIHSWADVACDPAEVANHVTAVAARQREDIEHDLITSGLRRAFREERRRPDGADRREFKPWLEAGLTCSELRRRNVEDRRKVRS